ncbi:MAG: hypothetical protein R3315_12245 [Woeseiaceae bacterium]|nr:hypothetical protein [Woeseiaceae bacterium]
MAIKLLGENFTPPDLRGKVTGKARYAEDFRVEGMVFAKLLLSPMPHARVTNIDASDALAMEGVFGILTADDVPERESPNQPILTNTPHFVGDPILEPVEAVVAAGQRPARGARLAQQIDRSVH